MRDGWVWGLVAVPVGGGRTRAGRTQTTSPDRWEATAGPAGTGRGAGGRRQGLEGIEPHVSTPGSAGVEGAGGTGGHGRASRRGAERSEAA